MQDLMPPINTPDSAFHDGDPTTGQLGTIVTALWLNNVQSATRDVQLEIKNVLAKAGIQPDPKKNNQLAEAISQIIGSGNYASTAYVDNGLNKKIDKANISGQKGNDNDKVPSLNLFTTETGKLATKAELATGLAGKQPMGDYATKEALDNNLNLKLDKTSVVQNTGSSTAKVISQDAATKLFMTYGAYGWGGITEDIPALSDTELAAMLKRRSTVTQVFRNIAPNGSYHFKYGAIAYFKTNDTYTALTAGYDGSGVKVIGGSQSAISVYTLWTDKNFNPDQYVTVSDNDSAMSLKLDKADVTQGSGTSKTKVISQEATTYLSLGINDKYTDMTSQRNLSTTYTNALSKAIFISLYTEDKTTTGIQLEVTVDGNLIERHIIGGDGYTRALTATFIVPPGSTYSIASNAAIRRWYELR
ncbi:MULTISPECIES: hypothetical protein [unclassified Providencia]|uniref:hypothetical protein n=1 Tax=unclassified Providencia TaxID=2633465 RepID=UPI002349ADCC|nr:MULTISPECIES: hypothetical protein [unclassified Providencia]WOB99262.1 hypothetical protein P3L55_18680 [Providencia sp. PROV046]